MNLKIDAELQSALDAFKGLDAKVDHHKQIALNPDATDGQRRDFLMHIENSKHAAYLLAHLLMRKIEEVEP